MLLILQAISPVPNSSMLVSATFNLQNSCIHPTQRAFCVAKMNVTQQVESHMISMLKAMLNITLLTVL